MKININSNLWQARKRAGLERKQVARLLQHRSADTISRYEKGNNHPNLENAFKLEVIYQTPLKLLYQDLFLVCRQEVRDNWNQNSGILPVRHWFPDHITGLEFEEFCYYAELLKKGEPTLLEWEMISTHIRYLMKTTSDYHQGKQPFSLS